MTARHRVVITGVGALTPLGVGGREVVGAALAAPEAADDERIDRALAALVDAAEARRLSRVCQLTLAAGRLAMADAGLDADGAIALIVGTELGDLRSTLRFADGYLERGAPGLSPLLFPNTVMNTMAAVTAIALSARDVSLTINAPTVAGELAIARGVAAVAAGRVPAALVGGVDEFDAALAAVFVEAGGGGAARGEGAAFLMLEPLEGARARGARVLGEVLATSAGALAAPPHGIGRRTSSPVIGQALRRANIAAAALRAVYTGANGDRRRDAWETLVLDELLARGARRVGLGLRFRQSSALGALKTIAAAGDGPALVHGLARGGSQVALVVGPPPAPGA